MPLDLFANEFDAGQQRAMRETAPALPVPFDQAFEAAWRSGRLFSQSTAQMNTNAAVFGEALDEVRQRTGVNVASKINYDDPTKDPWQQLNDQIGDIKATRPDLGVAVSPYADAEIQRRMVAKSRGALDDLADVEGREKTFGGKVGLMAGGFAASTADPMNLVAAPLVAPAGLGILGTALATGAISGASALVNEAIGAGYREDVQPGYGAGAPGRVGEAVAFGALTAGGMRGLANVWSRVKTGAWPRSVRDAGNIVESEAQIADSGRPPTMATAEGEPVHTELPLSAEGAVADEVAHREALSTAIDQVARGDPVDVGFEAWHGSGAKFDRFSSEKIGTGEGTQAFGYGHYVAENEATAKGYLPSTDTDAGDAVRAAQDYLRLANGDRERAVSDAAEHIADLQGELANEELDKEDIASLNIELRDAKRAQELLGSGAPLREGFLYRVRINADPERFVDSDRPFNEQNEQVKEGFRAAIAELGKDPWYPPGRREQMYDPNKSTEEIIAAIGMEGRARDKPAVLSDALRSRGIPGIKYLDQGSRASGEGTRNFVVFDDSLLEITHRNGEPVAKPAPEPTVASVPFMITRKMKTDLAARGFTPDQIAEMTPAQAHAELASSAAAPEPLPTTAAAEMRPEAQAETLASPQMTQALAADLERQTVGEKPAMVPVGVDRDGNEIMASLDSLLHDAQLDAEAAEQLEACAAPAPEAEAAE